MSQGHCPNRRLRLQRRLRGWSQEDVAAGLYRVATGLGEGELGVDATMVSRWERGTRRPRPRYVRLLCRLFDLPAEQLGLVREPELVPLAPLDPLGCDETERREFLHQVATLLGLAALPPFLPAGPAGAESPRSEPWERLDRALNRPGQVDVATVEHLERVTQALERLEPTAVSSRALLGPATGHLEAITTLLQAAVPCQLQARLCSLAGEAAALVGWLRWNLDDAEGASQYFRSGLRAAREADDRALGAYLVGAIACRLPLSADPRSTLRELRARTHGFSQDDASPATRAWLAAKEADAWAQLRQESECMRALDRAAALVDGLGHGDRECRPRFTVVDRNWLAGERGASLCKLGRVDAAEAILRQVLASLGPTSERDRLWLLTALAGAYVELGEPEEACRLAGSALTGARRMHLAPVVHLVTKLSGSLDRHRRSAAVQELDEQLRGVPGRGSSLALLTS
jgi:transcriptional regulator with XRE-family HTH domain